MMRLSVRAKWSSTRQLYRCFSSSPRLTADHVRIIEVGPRDGLQNEKNVISVETKLELIRRLAKTGVSQMEAGSFVPVKWVPQMSSTSEVFQSIRSSPPPAPHSIAYNYLVPNLRGMETLVGLLGLEETSSTTTTNQQSPLPSARTPDEVVLDHPHLHTAQTSTEISLFAAATETFSNKNTNCSIQESLDRSKPILALAKDRDIRARGYVSVALGCPYEGPNVDAHRVAELTATLLQMGCDQVSIADTTGMGTAPRTRSLLKTLREAGIQNEDIALHFHDTYGQALVNTVVGLEHGIRAFDSAVAGLGGCPFSMGATGNVPTEDLLHLLHSLGLHTNVDLDMMAQIGEWISTQLGRKNESRVGKATLARKAS